MSYFDQIEQLPEDPIFSQLISFRADPRSEKINLAIGAYKDEDGKSYVLNCVRKAERLVLEKSLDKDYLLMDGDRTFCQDVQQLLFGQKYASLADHAYTLQTIGGSGALRIGGDFLTKHGFNKIYLSDPTWANHSPIFLRAGMVIGSYSYFNPETRQIDFSKLCESIEGLPENSVILLHVCCHNPVGVDPTSDQWKTLSSIIKKKGLLPFFDFAYQGFARGIEEDALPIQIFAEDGHEMFISSSYSKNFGLYGERMGALTAVTHSKDVVPKLASQLKQLVRSSYSSPPINGARIIHTILNNPELKAEWIQEVATMRNRITDMRTGLCKALKDNGKFDFDCYLDQTGMFAYGALTPAQVERLRKDFAIYMPSNGRISIPGLTPQNLPYVAESIKAVF